MFVFHLNGLRSVGYIGGGVRGFIWGGVRGFIRGACVVLFGGRAWFYSGVDMRGFIWGGMRGFIQGGHAWFYSGGVRGFFSFFGYNEIRSMSGRYASYWNAFLFSIVFHTGHGDVTDITPSSSDESQCSGIVLPIDEAVELDEAGGHHGQRGFRERTR